LKDYAKYSFWLEAAADGLAPRPALQGSLTVDVAILGGGYSGLWTAYYLLRANPGLQVAILEKEIVGFGASGRNGGWCSSRFPITPAVLEERYGAEAARQLILAMFASVDEVGRICRIGDRRGLQKGSNPELGSRCPSATTIQASYAAYERLGLRDHFKLLRIEECNERVRVTNVQGGLYTREGASLHPGRLVRGLAAVVERRGGAIYENTDVTEVRSGSDARLITPTGKLVRAKRGFFSRVKPI
jgi:glycine/D-amino acid oxidase-like deaminating enzyme